MLTVYRMSRTQNYVCGGIITASHILTLCTVLAPTCSITNKNLIETWANLRATSDGNHLPPLTACIWK